MFQIAAGSDLRGRRTLEEGEPNVAVRCNNLILAWLVRARAVNPLDEEEDGNQEEENSVVMVRCGGENKEQDSEDGCQEGERLPTADFGGPSHRWIKCTARDLPPRTIL
jgi:hypothetical protein